MLFGGEGNDWAPKIDTGPKTSSFDGLQESRHSVHPKLIKTLALQFLGNCGLAFGLLAEGADVGLKAADFGCPVC